jgi:zinc transport system substrate-binding protein
MRKFSTIFLLVAVIFSFIPSCSAKLPYSEGSGELKIVASSFVPFDLARSVAGEKATVTVLQTDGSDLHDYVPTVSALKAISEADVFICIGGASDELWINDAIAAANNPGLKVIRLTDFTDGELGALEGHCHSEFCEENHAHTEHSDHEHTADDGHNHTADEHVWTSPKNVINVVKEIARVCTESDTENAPYYESNAASYTESLALLDAEYRRVFESSKSKTLIFADRFPFIYLTHEYGACYFAAFSGCGGELDASFDTAVRLTNAVKDNNLHYVIVTESSDKKLAKSISDATGCDILTLNSMQSVALSHIKSGQTYLGTVQDNLAVLKIALGV